MDKQLKHLLDDHEQRLSRLESLLIKIKEEKPRSSDAQNKHAHLTDKIIELRDSRFFSHPKTAEETHKKLQETYHCESNRVAMALLRISKRRELRRITKEVNEKTYKAYVW